MKDRIKLFITALIQVSLVASSTYTISHRLWIPVFITGFGISFLWTINVKKVAFGNNWDRFAYALGAGIGSLLGLWTSILIYE